MNYIKLMVALVLFSTIPAQCAPKAEFRGAWVTAWSAAFFDAPQADQTLEAAKKAKINNLFIQVRKVGDAYYDSSLEPRAPELAEGFDPLAYMIPKAHKMGIKVHAWVNVYRVWRGTVPPSDPLHIVNQHPDWLNATIAGNTNNADGTYLDPANAEARAHILRVIEEIVRRYPVDGFHLDYIRYPGSEWGYSAESVRQWQKATGRADIPTKNDKDWSTWRRSQVTGLVRSIYVSIKKIRPSAKLTAATVCWGEPKWDFAQTRAHNDALQDWKKWMTAGFLDAVTPMNYQSQSKSGERFKKWLQVFKYWKMKRPVYTGLYIVTNSPQELAQQARIAKNSGLGGWALFSFNATSSRAKIAEALSKT